MSRAWAAIVAGLTVLTWTVLSAAQAPQLQVQTDVETVGVGDVLHLIMNAQSGDAPPGEPQPGSITGFQLRGQNASPSQTHISINGSRSDRWGLAVDWALQAQRVGVFTLGPPSVVVGSTRYTGRGVVVRVVPAGQAPRRQPSPPSPFGFSPFDPWRGLIPGQDPTEPEPSAPSVTTDPKLALDAPGGALYFLHATVDKTAAVVGEQVVFSVYEYIDATSRAQVEVDESDVHDATATDFVKRPLLKDDQDAQLAGYAMVGGHIWQAKLVRRWALFPLHPGDLSIAPMSVTVVRPRGAAGRRTTEALTVHVSEPPVAGRPPLYALGDVGHFALTAQVTPREIEQGGAVGVHVELSGTGNLPSALATPAREGIEWLTPETHEQLGSIGRESFGGKRTFDYVVRIQRSGDIDLGELALQFWDPAAKRYDAARAPLGSVRSRPSAAGAAASADSRELEKLRGLPGPRTALEGERTSGPHADDTPLFWLAGVGAWPAVFGLAVAGRAAGRRIGGAWTARRTSPASDLRRQVAAADAACRGQDPRAADAAIMRALQTATSSLAGVSVLGAVEDEVMQRLERAGVTPGAAATVDRLLRECEAARFSPDAGDLGAVRDRWAQAQEAIRSLGRKERRASGAA